MSNNSITNDNLKVAVTVYIEPGLETVSVTSDKKVKQIRPNFMMVGNGTMSNKGVGSIDFLEEIVNSTKAEQFLLMGIKNGINYENSYKPVVKVIGTTKYEQNLITAGYKSLLDRNLVRRVKKSHYIINPNALIPIDYEGALDIWNRVATNSVDNTLLVD